MPSCLRSRSSSCCRCSSSARGVAALLPPLLGGLSIIGTFAVLRLLNGVFDLSVFALNLTTGMGLGLAIDYSLFIVSRYREEAAHDGFGPPALRRTLQTAGRTVLFSSITVAVAVAALAIFPQRFLYSMGIAGATIALLAAILALTVLPALLAVLGPRVNALSPPRLRRAAEREARPARSGAWYRLARLVTRRPAQIAVVSAAMLIAVGIPFTHIKFITVDARVLPASASSSQVQDALDAQFPPHRTTPLEVVLGAPARSPRVRALATRIARLPDVSGIAAPQPAGKSMSLLAVAPAQDPLSSATKQLVRDVRGIHTPFYLGVAGQTAAYIDLEHSLGVHLPAVLAVVVAATLIVLFLMTGSLVLPIKAVVMNALSLSAVFGILVLIFQDGNLQGLLGYKSLGALDATQPILLFAIGFGLATDYGVFLLARIKEAHDAGAANKEAIALGLERTGRIVTAAALLFAVALLALCDFVDRVRQRAWRRRGTRGTDRLLDRSRPAGAVADGAARAGQLVGAAAVAPPARAHRPERRRPATGLIGAMISSTVEDREAIWQSQLRRMQIGLTAANVIGAVTFFVFLMVLVPVPSRVYHDTTVTLLNVGLFVFFGVIVTIFANRHGAAVAEPVRRWFLSGAEPGPRERELALRQPLRAAQDHRRGVDGRRGGVRGAECVLVSHRRARGADRDRARRAGNVRARVPAGRAVHTRQ